MNPKKLLAWSFLFYFLLILLLMVIAPHKSSWNILRDDEKYPAHLPDFTQYEDVKEKKQAFFGFLEPIVEEANQKIRSQREDFLDINARFESGKALSPRHHRQLAQFIKQYKVKRDLELAKQIDILNLRINTVPKALVLSQAANESAWGTSRFAVKVNNLFGQWCFSKGCGLVPKSRATGAKHEVQSFDTVYDAVASYMNNLNTHRAYSKMRKLRLNLTQQGQQVTAIKLAGQLGSYSERGEAYIKEIRQMIRINKLE